MAFLTNRTVNFLNLHLALVNLLDQSFSLFGPIYLYSIGFSIPSIFALMALMLGLRAPFRLLSLPVIRHLGLKAATMIGATGYGLSFVCLSQVKGVDAWLVCYVLLYAIFNAMHWLCFHAYYSLAGESEKRGRQVAVGQALSTALAALSPLLSAFAITQLGYAFYFLLGFVIIAGMIAALSRCQPIALPAMDWTFAREHAFNLGAKIHFLESATSYPLIIGWLFTVYLYVGHLTSLGGIITFGVIAQTLYQLALGHWIDRGRGNRVAHAAGGLRITAILARAFLPLTLPRILAIETLYGIGDVHYMAVKNTSMYNAGKQAVHPLCYWLFAEMGWDLGAVIGAGGAALLLIAGVELRHVILIALPFSLLLWWLLVHHFTHHAYAKTN